MNAGQASCQQENGKKVPQTFGDNLRKCAGLASRNGDECCNRVVKKLQHTDIMLKTTRGKTDKTAVKKQPCEHEKTIVMFRWKTPQTKQQTKTEDMVGKGKREECQKTDTKTGKLNWQKGHDKNFLRNRKRMCWRRWGENQRKPVAVKAKRKGLTPVEKVMSKERKKKKCIGEKN